jgi:hypothetical protein
MRPAVAGQYGRMDHPRHAADLYETPPEAVEMLLVMCPCRAQCWNRVLVAGLSVRELCRNGLQVRASDLYDHGAEPALGIETGIDFLSMTSMSGCRSIVMNPPFRDAEAHVRYALNLLPCGGSDRHLSTNGSSAESLAVTGRETRAGRRPKRPITAMLFAWGS